MRHRLAIVILQSRVRCQCGPPESSRALAKTTFGFCDTRPREYGRTPLDPVPRYGFRASTSRLLDLTRPDRRARTAARSKLEEVPGQQPRGLGHRPGQVPARISLLSSVQIATSMPWPNSAPHTLVPPAEAELRPDKHRTGPHRRTPAPSSSPCATHPMHRRKWLGSA
jgi:hypothetical protein